ncbi:type II toxin-antitoxin system HicB family antitoxin [Microcoleus sp. BR0-C5]|uniref:type II toxin-antitoxin system HicB family antitoxin n=1 Tax=Microcoleus sp. BR0-C5 TaxID=2818713 RepID=UPI002FD5DBAD
MIFDTQFKWRTAYSAYAPDLPGCAATGATLAEVQQQIKEAIEFHLEGLRKDGLLIPEPTTLCEYVIERFLVKQ